MKTCPRCGAQIEIAAGETQPELPGLIFECAKSKAYVEKKLDENSGASLQSSDSVRFPIEESDSSNDSNRIDHSEEDLFESIREIVGEYEWGLNEKLWHRYFQSCPDALRYAVRKWKLLSGVQQRAIKHPPAWLTDRYKRARNELMRKSA